MYQVVIFTVLVVLLSLLVIIGQLLAKAKDEIEYLLRREKINNSVGEQQERENIALQKELSSMAIENDLLRRSLKQQLEKIDEMQSVVDKSKKEGSRMLLFITATDETIKKWERFKTEQGKGRGSL
jgi:SMC interacting uncharacterized protein involved in chromosome segregation